MQIFVLFFKVYLVSLRKVNSIRVSSGIFIFFPKSKTSQKVAQKGVEKIATMDILNKNTKLTRRKMDSMFHLGKILG